MEKKQPFSNLISDNPVKKGYSPNGAIWTKSSAFGNNLMNGMGTLTDVNASTGVDDNAKFSLDPSGTVQ